MSGEKQEQKDMGDLEFLLWLWDGVSGVLYCDVNFHLWPETEGAGVKREWKGEFLVWLLRWGGKGEMAT